MLDTYWLDHGSNCCQQGYGIAFSPTNDLIIVDSEILQGVIKGKIAAADFDETNNIIYALVTDEGFDPALMKISPDGKTIIDAPIPITTEYGISNFDMQGIAWQVQPTLEPIGPDKVTFNVIGGQPLITGEKVQDLCPSSDFKGVFVFYAMLKNFSGYKMENLAVRVAYIDGGNLLIYPTHSACGLHILPKQFSEYQDGILLPSESAKFAFGICLKNIKPFSFYVDLFGALNP